MSVQARLFSVVWILIGLVIFGIFAGSITTALGSVVFTAETGIYGAKVRINTTFINSLINDHHGNPHNSIKITKVQHNTTQKNSTIQYSTTKLSTAQHNTTQNRTEQQKDTTLQCSTTKYNTTHSIMVMVPSKLLKRKAPHKQIKVYPLKQIIVVIRFTVFHKRNQLYVKELEQFVYLL